ncbi:MAG TPA: prolipoprotein diacylglyceryl transferase family protein, partial [Candidatus Lustribacter sp.]|nr:prolipoprotein diacylglyceryl transferase family protein [Candidatus Lustribacter sp.]
FLDSAAPGVLVAQALGRFGNYFNNEIHGGPTSLPWGLQVYEWDAAAGHAVRDAFGNPVVAGVFHPTFLYEAIFCVALAAVIIGVERRRSLRPGQVFALYVMGYPVGRGLIELMRTDDANRILGLRLNVWTSVLVFFLGLSLFRRAARSHDPDRLSHDVI